MTTADDERKRVLTGEERVSSVNIRPLGALDASNPKAKPVKSSLEKLLAIYTEDLSTSPFVEDPPKRVRILGFEPILLQRIVFLGLPVIFGMLTQTAINQIDSIMVGRLPEKVAVAGTAALGPALLLLWFFGGFLSAISVGTQAMTSRRYGEGDAERAGRVLANSLVVAVISSVIVTFIALPAVEPYFGFITADPDVHAAGVSYSRIRILGIISMVAMASYKSFYDGIGQVLVHMVIAFLMNIINAVLNYALIFGKFGAPAMGIDGAAVSSVISSFAGVGMIILWSMRTRDRKLFKVYRLKNIRPSVARAVSMLSIYSGLATMFVMSGFAITYAIVGKIDKIEGLPGINTSATSIIINIMMLMFMTCIAFGTSTATLVSQSLGAKKSGLAARYGWQSVYIMVVLMSLLGLLLALFPEVAFRIYLPEEIGADAGLKDAVIAAGSPALRVCGFITPMAAAALVLTQALYGAGETRYVMVVELFLHFFCLVPLSYVLGVTLELGLIGCWYAAATYVVALAITMGVKFWSGGWKKTVI